ncbi:hypothetical protein LWM68_46175 [Niabella sp. W65]|nr:hypothetical protein [Niabella sp. W65]MCH7369473.1 hypothetical protein [Niabella sp. W65]
MGHWLRTPDLEIALMDKWEDKLEKMALQTVNENVTSISGVPTWTLILFKRLLEMTGKKRLPKYGPTWNCICTAAFRLLPTASNLKILLANPFIT